MHSTNTGTDHVEKIQGWMFPQAPENDTLTFYSQWTEFFMHLDKIHMVGFVWLRRLEPWAAMRSVISHVCM